MKRCTWSSLKKLRILDPSARKIAIVNLKTASITDVLVLLKERAADATMTVTLPSTVRAESVPFWRNQGKLVLMTRNVPNMRSATATMHVLLCFHWKQEWWPMITRFVSHSALMRRMGCVLLLFALIMDKIRISALTSTVKLKKSLKWLMQRRCVHSQTMAKLSAK